MKNIKNQRFGRLVAIEPTSKRAHGSVIWKCMCDCGEVCEISHNALVWGGTRSCGCLLKEQQAAACKSGYVERTRLASLTARKPSDNTSGIKGVSRRKDSRKWRAYITCQGEHIWLGSFNTKEEAIEARRKAEQEYFDPILEKHGRRITEDQTDD